MKAATLRMRKWRQKNHEKDLENSKRWASNNPRRLRAKYKRWFQKNKEKMHRRNREYHQNNRDSINVRHRLNKHKITSIEYDAMLKKQRNRCSICRCKFEKTPHIDHCHRTNKNRGLLCSDCNLGLGRFKDNKKYLRSAIQYLRRHK